MLVLQPRLGTGIMVLACARTRLALAVRNSLFAVALDGGHR